MEAITFFLLSLSSFNFTSNMSLNLYFYMELRMFLMFIFLNFNGKFSFIMPWTWFVDTWLTYYFHQRKLTSHASLVEFVPSKCVSRNQKYIENLLFFNTLKIMTLWIYSNVSKMTFFYNNYYYLRSVIICTLFFFTINGK